MKYSMEYCAIFDFDYSIEQLFLLRKYGISEAHASSWMAQTRNKDGVVDLFLSAGIISDRTTVSIVDISASLYDFEAPLDEFISEFTLRCLKGLDDFLLSNQKSENDLPIRNISLNLLPFTISRTLADKISYGLYTAIREKDTSYKEISITVFTRNTDSFVKSNRFRYLLKSGNFPNEIYIIGYNRRAILFKGGEFVSEVEIPEPNFNKILNFTKKDLYRALVFETNSYIGHFNLQSSHARTHYDLFDFVTRDRISQDLLSRLKSLVYDGQRITVFGIGLENASIDHLGYKFVASEPDNRKYEPLTGRHMETYEIKRHIENSDLVLILTDIINSGNTIKKFLDKLSNFNEHNIPIKIFSIAAMRSSDTKLPSGHEIYTAITIKRDHYPADENLCLLCKLKQPIIDVQR